MPTSTYELSMVAITNFLLVMVFAFTAGLLYGKTSRYAPTWWWAGTSLGIAVSSFLGGINHGFFEGHQPAISLFLYKATAIAVGIATIGIYITTFLYFLNRNNIRNILILLAVIDFVGYTIYTLQSATAPFLPVMINYGIALLVMMIFNFLFWKTKGSWQLVIFFIIIVLASILQQSSLKFFNGLLDYNSIYHLLGTLSSVFFYYGKPKIHY